MPTFNYDILTPAVTGTLYTALVPLQDGVVQLPASTTRQLRQLPKAVVGQKGNGAVKSFQLSTTLSSVSGTSPTITATLQRNATPWGLDATITDAITSSATTINIPDTATAPSVGELVYLLQHGNAASGKDDGVVTRETVRVTAVGSPSGGKVALTVVRVVEGTTGVAFGTEAKAYYSNSWADVPSQVSSPVLVTTGAVSASNGAAVAFSTPALGYPAADGVEGTYFRLKLVAGGTTPSAIVTGSLILGN